MSTEDSLTYDTRHDKAGVRTVLILTPDRQLGQYGAPLGTSAKQCPQQVKNLMTESAEVVGFGCNNHPMAVTIRIFGKNMNKSTAKAEIRNGKKTAIAVEKKKGQEKVKAGKEIEEEVQVTAENLK